MEKPTISKHVFRVSSTSRITPHYIRVKLTSDEPSGFEQCSPGANNKIFVPPAGQKKVEFAIFDGEKGEWVMPGENIKPIVRTYTHRGMDAASGEVIIDFVDHGEGGPASAWARSARVGDELGIAMKIRSTVHYPEGTGWLLLVGDATGIPVICCILESLPRDAKGRCIVEVPSQDDIHPELVHPGFEITWLINANPQVGSKLAQTVRELALPADKESFAYIACEYSSVKAIRSYFKQALGWGPKQYYAFSYWKAGSAEDKSANERREEKHEQ
ncbi:siderophore-interacting protein [Sphingobacterium sp. JB170]|uniref:siderophore-interacting protein n=1 Tax=Sphingobacterium sp. JB170 TaxID=1434842 RepID=UPI00097F45ED|nr:siderophore-interacting protein [Sphingobacterium sp. JB170]SJN19321.1 iron-chelator utilization protein [Sphingobacterium sp. JB170]